MFDFFNSISSFQKKLETQIPTKRSTIEEYVGLLRDIYQKVGPDPQKFIIRMDNKLEQVSKDLNAKIDFSFLPPIGDYKKRSKTLNYKGRGYSLQTESVVPDRVYHNVYPADLRDLMEDKEVMYLTYLIDKAGIHMGRYDNIFEIGTGHGLLFTNEFKDLQTILVAGEIEIDSDQNRIRFNFQSGTYMKNTQLERFPLYKEFLIEFVGAVLSKVKPDQLPFSEISFQEEVLFPNIFPTLSTLRKDLINRPDKVFDIEEKVWLDTIVNFSTIEQAKNYFSRYPYERVQIRQGGVVYHNPYPENPTLFVAYNFDTVEGASEYFSSHPYQSIVVKQGNELYCNPFEKHPTRFIPCDFPLRGRSRLRDRPFSRDRPLSRSRSPLRSSLVFMRAASPTMYKPHHKY